MQDKGATAGDFNRAVYDRLKPGGSYVIVDHAAAAGAGTSAAQSLQRSLHPFARKSRRPASYWRRNGGMHHPREQDRSALGQGVRSLDQRRDRSLRLSLREALTEGRLDLFIAPKIRRRDSYVEFQRRECSTVGEAPQVKIRARLPGSRTVEAQTRLLAHISNPQAKGNPWPMSGCG